ncbi:hypothetical protein E2C01_090122 [Portunus trituberculatus]|uniref:Uncharacterized protein n=1 Tax=Portunus trituberculatus TaxID=210409 RepID=A0A5B7JAM6_PORTR|nr:hypothetical protein [Portunus trituberculatus]
MLISLRRHSIPPQALLLGTAWSNWSLSFSTGTCSTFWALWTRRRGSSSRRSTSWPAAS